MTVPASLWKYCNIERLQSLETGLFRFTQPSALNDPFDAQPQLDAILPKNALKNPMKYLSRKEFDTAFYKRANQAFANKNEFSESYRQFLYESMKNGSLSFESLSSSLSENAIASALQQGIDKAIGIFSLSETNDNILMWSHYAQQHNGICIGFDGSHPYFSGKNENVLERTLRVKYKAHRPQNASELAERLNMFLQKSPDWKYEKEWRRISLIQNAEMTINEGSHGAVHLFKIPIAAIHSVIFVLKVDTKTVINFQRFNLSNTLIERLSRNISPIKMFRAKRHPTKFKIVLEEIS